MTDFKRWVQEKYYSYQAELEIYKIECRLSAKQYFNKYKYWLKRQYRATKKR